MPTKIYRLGENLYRWNGAAHGNGWPVGVESFVKDAGTRQIIGRWLDCPNWGIAKRLRGIAKGVAFPPCPVPAPL